jgi:putative methionine-R-sulfoxide reductase with GAF domain
MEPTGSKPAGASRQVRSITERRHGVRHRVHSPAYASLDAGSRQTAPDLSEILDISEEGMSIRTTGPLEIDSKLNLSLDLAETKTRIRTLGQVVWWDGGGRAGVRFMKLAGQSLQGLKEWLFANVLNACENARPYTPSHDGEELESTVTGQPPETGRNGFAREASAGQGNGEGLPELVAVQPERMANGYDQGAALQTIAEQALNATAASGVAIALSQGEELICLASAGSDAPRAGSRLQAGFGFSGECIRSGRTLRCDDSETDDRVDRESCRALGLRSMVAVPVRVGSRVAGLLEAFSSQAYAFNVKETGLLQQLSLKVPSVMGYGSETPREVPEGLAARMQPARIPAPQPAEVLAGTMEAVKPPSHERLNKILLVAAGLALLFVLAWLLAPWVSSQMRRSDSGAVRSSEAQAPVAKPATLPADVTDLAGLRKVAESGDPAAQFALGARYATGDEVRQDYSEAVRWFTLAADRGHIIAQATLGAYYWAGRGVTQDLTKAYFWSVLAQAGGDQASKYRVAVLTSRMSRNQILAAQQQANDWLRNHQLAGNIPPSQ